MQIYWNSWKNSRKERDQLVQDWFDAPIWQPFLYLEHQYGVRDVVWKRSIVNW